jgi:pilus assembly protein CpaE
MADTLRVLITDEDGDSRVAARKALQRAGLEIAGETGFGTVAVSTAADLRPDAIMVALEEPIIRALETAESLANVLPSTPIIVYSSKSDAEAIRRAMRFGARDYLVKPLQADRLREAIFQAMEQEERRQMRHAGQLAGRQPRGTVITVTGAKGGIGKTVLSVNLALALRKETGKSVVIVDADAHFGDVATMLDVTPAVTVDTLLQRLPELDRLRIREFVTAAPGGIDIVPGTEEDDLAIRPAEDWKKLIDLLAQVYEFVVIDTSGSFDRFVASCIEASALALLVTSGEVSSIRDTAAAVRRMDRWGIDPDRVRVVVNRTGRDNNVPIDDLQAGIGRRVSWEIPYDRRVPQSVQLGRPAMFEPKSDLAAGVSQLARALAGTHSVPAEDRKRSRLLDRFRGMRGGQHDATMARLPELPDSER